MKMKPPSINELRKLGYKVKSTHFRRPNESVEFFLSRREIDEANAAWKKTGTITPRYSIHPCGGRIEIVLESPDGHFAKGVANCNLVDNFNKKIGTAMALGRAWKPFAISALADTIKTPRLGFLVGRKIEVNGVAGVIAACYKWSDPNPIYLLKMDNKELICSHGHTIWQGATLI